VVLPRLQAAILPLGQREIGRDIAVIELFGRRGNSLGSLRRNDTAMALYTREAHGVFAMPLYTSQRCSALTARVRRARQWSDAEIVRHDHGAVQSIPDPAARAARILQGVLAAGIERDFEEKIHTVVRPLIKRIWDVNLSECQGTQLVRYKPGGHYVPHTDAGADEFANRYFTVLCYLNQDFEGGKTSFPSLNYAATPESGKAIIFPATFLHCAEPVVRGEKLILLSWVCGPVPIRWV
jgi:predicted 2-oxoglutarate/Fe(II)-dependent dioxygenase YbiX